MTKRQIAWKKFVTNLLKFTAPALAVLFAQLALGTNWKASILLASYILWGILADYFKKLK